MSIHLQVIYNDPHIGVDAVYNDGSTDTDVRAILELSVERFNGSVVSRQDEVSLQCSQVSSPKQGDTVTIDGTAYKLVNRIKDDGMETRWSVRA